MSMSLFQKFLFNDIDMIDGLDNVKQHCCNVLVAVLSTTRIGKHRNFSNGLWKALQVLKHTGTYYITTPFALNFSGSSGHHLVPPALIAGGTK